MSRSASSATDMRGFRWPLAPLERKLDSEIQAARLVLTRLQEEEETVQRSAATLHEETARHVQYAAPSGQRGVDSGARLRALHYVVHLRQVSERRQMEIAELRSRIQAGRELCLRLQRQLACVDKLRESAQGAYATAESRKLAKESDLMWLAARARRGAP